MRRLKVLAIATFFLCCLLFGWTHPLNVVPTKQRADHSCCHANTVFAQEQEQHDPQPCTPPKKDGTVPAGKIGCKCARDCSTGQEDRRCAHFCRKDLCGCPDPCV
jgi:hypothetical protein